MRAQRGFLEHERQYSYRGCTAVYEGESRSPLQRVTVTPDVTVNIAGVREGWLKATVINRPPSSASVFFFRDRVSSELPTGITTATGTHGLRKFRVLFSILIVV